MKSLRFFLRLSCRHLSTSSLHLAVFPLYRPNAPLTRSPRVDRGRRVMFTYGNSVNCLRYIFIKHFVLPPPSCRTMLR